MKEKEKKNLKEEYISSGGNPKGKKEIRPWTRLPTTAYH